MEDNYYWKNSKEVLDDYDVLSDFYDPNVQVNSNIMKNLPRSTRGRGTKIVDSDTDEDASDLNLSDFSDFNYNQGDLKEIDVVREYEVQDALRSACGIGHSNRVIESHWRAEKRDIPKCETQLDIENVQKDSGSNKIKTTGQHVNSVDESSNKEKNTLNSSKVINEDSNSDTNNEIRRNGISRRTTYVHKPNTEIRESKKLVVQGEDVAVHSNIKNETPMKIPAIEETFNNLNDFHQYYSDSSDENIILESCDLDDTTNNFTNINNTSDKRKGNRKKYKPVDIDIKLPTQKSTLVHNEYTKIPSQPTSFTKAVKSVLNPNAKEFHCSFSNNHDSYKLASETDFPPLS